MPLCRYTVILSYRRTVILSYRELNNLRVKYPWPVDALADGYALARYRLPSELDLTCRCGELKFDVRGMLSTSAFSDAIQLFIRGNLPITADTIYSTITIIII